MDFIPLDERAIKDEDVFSALDLTLPGLNPVKEALDSQDLPAAKNHLIRYLEKRKAPFFLFDYRNVGIGISAVSGRLAKDEQIFRHTYPHLRAVFALLGPAEAVGLIVFPDNICYDSLHAHVGKAVLGVMPDTVAVERIDRLTAHAAQSHRNNAVFDMDNRHAPGLERSVKIRCEVVHLLKELLIAF